MKKKEPLLSEWSEKFLLNLTSAEPAKCNPAGWERNAKVANRQVRIPKELFRVLQSRALLIHPQWERNHIIFVAGVCVGYKEAMRRARKPKK